MSGRVQRFDPETGNYVLLDGATGMLLQDRPGVREPGKPLSSPFGDVEEIEPIERARLKVEQTDPMPTIGDASSSICDHLQTVCPSPI
jgi:hypothetical protein